MSTAKLILLLLTLATLSGCAEFQHPLFDLSKAKTDPALNGIWMVDDITTLYIASRNDHEHAVVVVTKAISGGVEASELSIYPTTLGSESYLNAAFKGKTINTAWAFFRYRVHNNMLDLALVDHNYLRQAVITKQLKGFIKSTKCNFFVNPANYSRDLKDAGQAMGILALNSLMRTMCHESLEIPIISSPPEHLRAFFESSATQQHFVSLDSPRQITSWRTAE